MMRMGQGYYNMESLLMLLVHLLVMALVFGLLYWVITLVVAVIPPLFQNDVRAILFVILAIIAIGFLLGEFGLYGTWGFGSGHHRW